MKIKIAICSIFALSFMIAGCGGSSSSSGGGGGTTDPAASTFTSGGNSLTATTSESGSTKTTTVTDASGATILTMAVTVGGVSLTSPTQTTPITTTFTTALTAMPTNFAVNALGAYMAGQTAGYSAMCLTKDSPGCDWFPDYQCTLSCCADHDACYLLNSCSATSWLLPWPITSLACINCNGLAQFCILSACSGVTENRANDRCFDARCGEYYDCGEPDCYTCTSPCDDASGAASPARCTATVYTNCCGNGSCELGETRENCAGDCVEGSGYNTCCLENSDCTDETGTSCGASCCCCGLGEVCTRDGSHVCTGSASMSLGRPESTPLWLPVPEKCLGKPKVECFEGN